MSHVTLSADAGVTVLTIDRPPANAFDLPLLDELAAAMGQLSDDVPAALVVAGRPGCFSAGLDLKSVPSYGPAEHRHMVQAINTLVLTAYGLPCPVVAAVTGHAIAGGLVLTLCADYRIASTDGRYGLTEVKVGVDFPKAAIGVVGAELSTAAARVLVLGNRLVDAQESARLGVFDELVAPEEVLSRAVTVAGELAAFPARSYARAKADLREETLTRFRAVRIATDSRP
jgi:enoyl-CoA hydratase